MAERKMAKQNVVDANLDIHVGVDDDVDVDFDDDVDFNVASTSTLT